ncbi:MAG: LemA family protein [Lepagella sp.]
MKKSYIIIGAIALVIIIIIGWFVSTRNGLVTIDENVNKAWSEVEVQYQRRLDLIPNLVATVKGYAEHEQSTLVDLTAARTGLQNSYNAAKQSADATQGAPATEQDMDAYNAAQQQLSRSLSIYVNAVHEAYPDLKANENFQDLQAQLEGTENRIAKVRADYTEAVREYNVTVRRFPASIVASISGFNIKPQFKADAAAATAPTVEF